MEIFLQIIYFKMSNKFHNKIFFLVALLLSSLAEADFVLTKTYNAIAPTGIETYNLVTGDVIEVILYGAAGHNPYYNSFLAADGTALDTDSTFLAEGQTSGSDLTFSFTITADGTYNLWTAVVDAVWTVVPYHLQVTINGVLELDQSKFIYFNEYNVNVFWLPVIGACSAKYVLTGNREYWADFYGPNPQEYDYTFARLSWENALASGEILFDLDEAGDWFLIIEPESYADLPDTFTLEYYTDSAAACTNHCDSILGATQPDPMDTAACLCQTGYSWNGADCGASASSTELDCSQVEHAEGSDGSEACKCQTNYAWNSEEETCEINKAIIIVPVVVGAVLIIGAVIFIKYCKGRGKYTSNSSPGDADYSKGNLKVENLPQASNEIIS